jgi:tRNA threonylcarbamoyladenosine biosynthesis protein TsaB
VKLLAIDTATENCSAALLLDGHLRVRERLLERGHVAHILAMVDALLAEAGIGLAALDAIAFGRGPGAFTGVRLAASVTQGLAFGAGLPVVPVSDLRALAQRAIDLPGGCIRVLACLDARMQEVYFGAFVRGSEGLAAAEGEEQVAPAAAVRLPPGWPAEQAPGKACPCGAGPGFSAYPELLRLLGPAPRVHDLLPRAQEIARMAVPEVGAGRVLPPEQALPVYLRNNVTQPPRTRH